MELLVAEPLVLAAVTGGEGVDGAIQSSAPIATITTAGRSLFKSTFA